MERNLAAGPIVWLGIILITCLLLVIFQTALWLVLPIFLAVFFYYVLSPWVHLGVSKGLSRSRAVLLVTVVLTLGLAAGGLILEPKISTAVRGIRNGQAEDYITNAIDLFTRARNTLSEYFPMLKPPPAPPAAAPGPLGVVTFTQPGNADAAPTTATNNTVKPAPPAEPNSTAPPPSTTTKPTLPAPKTTAPDNALEQRVATWTQQYSGGFLLEALHWIPSLLLVPYITYFFLLDGPRFKRFLVQAIPNAFFEKTLYLFYRVEDQVRRYFRGLLLLTLLDASCLAIGLWMLGLKAPIILALIAAVLAWLPYLGSIAGCLIAVVVSHHDAPDSNWLPYEVIALFIIVRLCDDFIFLPLTVGRSLRMHPLITVLMILLGGAVAGMSGLLLVMPVLGVVMVAGQIIGELVTDERVIARHRHARELRRLRARADL